MEAMSAAQWRGDVAVARQNMVMEAIAQPCQARRYFQGVVVRTMARSTDVPAAPVKSAKGVTGVSVMDGVMLPGVMRVPGR